jgi:hypothetical protein
MSDSESKPILPNELKRVSYFVARHQWKRVQKQWTCLAPDRPHGWTDHDFEHFVQNHRWVFARTMVSNPHFYTLRRNALHSLFDDAVRYIRDLGWIEYFGGKPYKMLHHLTHKYWTMGAPLDITILINRKSLTTSSVQPSEQSPPSPLSFWPESVERLTREECLDEDRRPLDTDDFENFVRLVREHGDRKGGYWYLGLGDYVYWTRGTPSLAIAINRARRTA